MKKFIVFLCVLVLTLSSITIQVYATEINTGDITNEVTPTIDINNVNEVLALGVIADMMTSRGVSFDFSQYTGSYDNFIEYILNSIGNAGASAFNYVSDQLITNGNNPIDWIRNIVSNTTPFTGAVNLGLSAFNIASKTPSTEEETPEINEDYSFLNTINNLYLYGYEFNTSNFYQFYSNNLLTPIISVSNCTIISSSNSGFTNRHIPNNENYPPSIYFTDSIQSIYVNFTDNQFIVSYPNFVFADIFSLGSDKYQIGTGNNSGIYIRTSSVSPAEFTTSFNTLLSALQYIYGRFSNINLYVNNELWIKSSSTPANKIIYDEDSLQYADGKTINVVFPQGTKFDYNTLKQIIEDIINNQDVLTYSDIQSVFVDYNGQQAIATYQVNYMPDDDTINIMYPTQPNFEQFENDMSEITGNTSGIFLFTLLFNTLPPEVWGALCAGALIVLFACLIKRMLE